VKKILVIEDDINIRETLVDILSIHEYDVSSESNGRSGIATALSVQPDLIICDIMMPEMNGYETLEHIREMKSTSSVPFIFLSAKSEKSDFRTGMNLGADDYLTKPFKTEELLNAIETRISKSEKIENEYGKKIKNLKLNLKGQSKRIEDYTQANSHMVRAPMARIMGLMNLILKHELSQSKVMDYDLIKLLNESCLELDQVLIDMNEILSKSNGSDKLEPNKG